MHNVARIAWRAPGARSGEPRPRGFGRYGQGGRFLPKNKINTRLVVVGSSAGGIEALSRLVATLPEGLNAPVVIAQHLDPARESRLQEILARRSRVPVRTVADHEQLESGVVYVIPSDRHVNVTPSEIDLRVDTKGRPKPSVDMLM